MPTHPSCQSLHVIVMLAEHGALFSPRFVVDMLKHTESLKEFYSESPYPLSAHLTILYLLSIHQLILSMHFKVSFRY